MLRFITAVVFAAIPVAALGSDASVLGGPQSSNPGQSIQGAGPASNQSSSLLQPANTSDGSLLQSTGTNGVTQSPDQSALQRPATSEEAKLFIQGDADSSDAASADGGDASVLLILALILATTGLIVGLIMLSRRRVVNGPVSAVVPSLPTLENSPVEEPPVAISEKSTKKTKSKKKSSKKRKSVRKSK